MRLSALQLYRNEILKAKLSGGTIVKPKKISGIENPFHDEKKWQGYNEESIFRSMCWYMYILGSKRGEFRAIGTVSNTSR